MRVGTIPPSERLAGPDVVRGVALIGVVVMNYHGYLLLDGGTGVGDGWAATLFHPWRGPLSTRFAATFVLVAGVGVTLLTRSSIGDPVRVRAARWRLTRRGVLLYTVGLVLDEVWPGTILPYYGAMFVVAAVMFTWRTRWILLAGLGAAIASAGLRWWQFERARDGHATTWLSDPEPSARGYLFDVMVNGTHPLLPWLAFFCAGIVLGRMLTQPNWRTIAIATGAVLFAVAAAVSAVGSTLTDTTGLATLLTSPHPFDRGIVYVASALGSALVAYGLIDWVAGRLPHATDPLRRAGQLTLTLYLAHVVVFELAVHQLAWIEPSGLDAALAFAGGFWVVAIAAGSAWQRRFGRGPAERFYRSFGG